MTAPSRLVRVGPFRVFYSLVTGRKGYDRSHVGLVHVTYLTVGAHGFPAYEETNRALEARIHDRTREVFTEPTGEGVAARLFEHLDGFTAPEWEKWGGHYQLHTLDLDVIGVRDAIGHDASTTRYTVTRGPLEPPSIDFFPAPGGAS